MKEWWNETSRLMQKHIGNIPLITGGDANLSIPWYLQSSNPELVGTSIYTKHKQEEHEAPFAECIAKSH